MFYLGLVLLFLDLLFKHLFHFLTSAHIMFCVVFQNFNKNFSEKSPMVDTYQLLSYQTIRLFNSQSVDVVFFTKINSSCCFLLLVRLKNAIFVDKTVHFLAQKFRNYSTCIATRLLLRCLYDYNSYSYP